jgi:hypothetical protein
VERRCAGSGIEFRLDPGDANIRQLHPFPPPREGV